MIGSSTECDGFACDLANFFLAEDLLFCKGVKLELIRLEMLVIKRILDS